MSKCPNCFVPVPVVHRVAPPPGRGKPQPAPAVVDTPLECPNPACRRPYPPGWGQAGSTCIVMAGATTAGKSIFIAVMLKQLKQYATAVGWDVRPASPAVAKVFQEVYVDPLYHERGILPATPPVREDRPTSARRSCSRWPRPTACTTW